MDNDYRAFLEEFDVEELDELQRRLRAEGQEGTSLEGRVLAGTVLGRIEIVDRQQGRYSLYNPVTREIVHVNTTTSSHQALLEVIRQEILRRIRPYESLEQYYFIKHGTETD